MGGELLQPREPQVIYPTAPREPVDGSYGGVPLGDRPRLV